MYFSQVGDLGFAHELGNYAEYSGAPNEEETLNYARTLLDVSTGPGLTIRHHNEASERHLTSGSALSLLRLRTVSGGLKAPGYAGCVFSLF